MPFPRLFFLFILVLFTAHVAHARQRPDTGAVRKPRAVMPPKPKPATAPNPVAKPATAPKAAPAARVAIPLKVPPPGASIRKVLAARPLPPKQPVNAIQKAALPKSVADSMARLKTKLQADSMAAVAKWKADSLRTDSVQQVRAQLARQNEARLDSLYGRLLAPAGTRWLAKPSWQINQVRKPGHRETIFYTLLALAAFLAASRAFFPKYHQSLYTVVFQSSFRQRQTRDQLYQDLLPSLWMHLFFVATIALLASLLNMRHQWLPMGFLAGLGSAGLLLSVIYLIKFGFIWLAGWAFHATEPARGYAFVVGMVNKLGAMLLLPFVALYAFAGAGFGASIATVMLVLAVLLLLYRYVMAVAMLRTTVRMHLVHFLVYICAVEVLPLLIMYKFFTQQIVKGTVIASLY